jgi:hypothetical protein
MSTKPRTLHVDSGKRKSNKHVVSPNAVLIISRVGDFMISTCARNSLGDSPYRSHQRRQLTCSAHSGFRGLPELRHRLLIDRSFIGGYSHCVTLHQLQNALKVVASDRVLPDRIEDCISR